MHRRSHKPGIRRTLRKVTPGWLYIRWLVWRHKLGNRRIDWMVAKRYADPSKASVDVGANRGVWLHILAPHSSHVYAYEPDPQMVRFARRYAPGNATIKHCALSDHAGWGILRTPIWGGEPSRTHGSLSKDFSGNETTRQRVPLCRLDDSGLKNVGFVKIDVEGHEMEVLSGAELLIETQRPVIWIEVEPRHGGDPGAVTSWLEAVGYRGRFHWRGRWFEAQAYDLGSHAASDEGRGVTNFLFVPEARAQGSLPTHERGDKANRKRIGRGLEDTGDR